MKLLRVACVCLAACGPFARGQDILDRAEQALSISAFDDSVRGRVSGTLDLEGYSFQQPPPALIDAAGHALFVPRLAVFLDAQIGSRVYVFAQARVDRGFDPDDDHGEARLDEYAVRFTPLHDARLNLQLGKFATIVGNWTARHASWTNPFINAPLPYEHLTGVWDAEAVRFSNQLLLWSHVRAGLAPGIAAREKYLRLPIIWGPSYAPGVAVSGALGRFRYAAEVKSAALASRPDTWTPANTHWNYPTVSARAGFRPNAAWDVGVSASVGSYLRPFADRTIVAQHGRGDYREIVVGQDVSFAWHHLQVWTEIYATRFEIPVVGNADVLAYYAEAKYKFTPQLSAALRWNEELFGTVRDRGGRTRWERNLWRIDAAPAWRFSPHVQLKLQYSLQHGDVPDTRERDQSFAAQLTVRF